MELTRDIMKKWTGFWLILVVLILGTYFLMGFIVENTLNKNIKALPKNPIISAHLDDYHRGWFSSRGVFTLDMHIPEQNTTDKNGAVSKSPPVDFTLNFPLTMKHGPVIFTDNGVRFGIGQVTTVPQTHYGMFINYLNRSVFRYTLPSFSMKGNANPKEGAFELDWKGLKTFLSVSSNIDDIDATLKLYGLSASANNTELKIGEVDSNFDLRNKDGLWLGKSHFLMPNVSMNMASQPIFTLEGFDLKLGADVVEKSLNIEYEFSLNKLLVNNKTYGPGHAVLRVKNLDPEAMAKISQMQLSMLQTSSDSNIPMLALLAEVPKLFTQGSELEFSEQFDVPEGKITGNLKMSLPKNESGDVGQLMQKAQGEGQFKAPIAFVRDLMIMSVQSDLEKNVQSTTTETPDSEPAPTSDFSAQAKTQVEAKLQDYVTKGLLKVEGTDYVINFKLENQQFNVNGQPFDPNSLN